MFSAKQSKQKTGILGEEKACEFLRFKGYRIIEKNYQKPWGEIDIITMAPDKTLVFFEVKTMRLFDDNLADSLKPEDNLSKGKLNKIRRSAQMFSAKHFDMIHKEKGWRIDLLALTFQQNNCIINHYQNI